MPLSEQEQRLLDQIERGLYADDPKFANAVRATEPHAHYRRRFAQTAVGFAVGVCLLVAGMIVDTMPVSAVVGGLGFLLMLLGCLGALLSWRRMRLANGRRKSPKRASRSHGSKAHGSKASGPKASFMERMEERYRRRREGS